MHDIRPFIPQLFDNPGTLLYIGARVDAHSWLEELYQAGNEVIILEVWPGNIDGLNAFVRDNAPYAWVVLGDVRNIGRPAGLERFDYIFWWHGPEHLQHPDIEPTLQELEAKCNRLIALACPYGLYPQGDAYGNPHERHLSTLYPEFFQVLGYDVRTDGAPDEAGSEIVAWKVMSGY